MKEWGISLSKLNPGFGPIDFSAIDFPRLLLKAEKAIPQHSEIIHAQLDPPFVHKKHLVSEPNGWDFKKVEILPLDIGRTSGTIHEWIPNITQLPLVVFYFDNSKRTKIVKVYTLGSGQIITKREREPTTVEIDKFKILQQK